MQLPKRYTLQYEHVKKNAKLEKKSGIQEPHEENNYKVRGVTTKLDNNREDNEKEENYVILDPSKKFSTISSKRLKKDGIDINYAKNLPIKPNTLTEDVKNKFIMAKLELDLLFGKEKSEKKVLVYVSDELNEEFCLGNDFLSSYLITKKKINKYILTQDIEIEVDGTPNCEQRKYKVQYKHISEKSENKEDDEKKQYVILDPSKKYSMISSKRLEKEGKVEINKIDIKKLSIKPTEDMKSENFVELNLLIGKENLEKKILVYVSEELDEEFYLGNDFLSSYSTIDEEKDNVTKYNLRQEIEIEWDASGGEQKKYKVQYNHKANLDESDKEKKYLILDPSKESSIISLKRLENEGIEIKTAELELNLLIGKEKLKKKILVYASEEPNEEFYLGNDFLLSYSIEEEKNGVAKLRQEIEIERDISEREQKKYQVQYNHKADLGESDKGKKYLILDRSKENSIVSLKRLAADGVDINELSVNLTEKTTIELDLLIGKDELEVKIFAHVSDEFSDCFYLGNDFLSSYSTIEEEEDNITKYKLRQEVEIEETSHFSTSSSSKSSFAIELSSRPSPLTSPNLSPSESSPKDENINEVESINKGGILESINKGTESIKEGFQRLIPPRWKLLTPLEWKSLIPSKWKSFISPELKSFISPELKSFISPELKSFISPELKSFIPENIKGFIKFRSSLLYFFIPLIVASFAIIMFNVLYTNPTSKNESGSDFDEFVKYAEQFGYDINSIELPSTEVMKRSIIEGNILANRIDQSVAFKDTGPRLVINLNEFGEKLEIAKSSYTKMYSDGVWFLYSFEQTIKNILDYISAESLITSIQRKIEDKEKIYLLRSIEDSIEALHTFYASVDQAYKDTLVAESFRNGTHHQVIKAKNEVQKFIHNNNNPSYWRVLWNFICSLFDRTRENDSEVDVKIATTTEYYLENIDENLETIAGTLLQFKENFDKIISFLHKFSASTEPLEQVRWNKYEIKKAENLLNSIKDVHKKFKLKAE